MALFTLYDLMTLRSYFFNFDDNYDVYGYEYGYDNDYEYDEYAYGDDQAYYDDHAYEYEYKYYAEYYDAWIDGNMTIVEGLTPLHMACTVNALEFVKKLLEIPRIEVDLFDSDGDTPLLICATWGSASIIRLLYLHGADVNGRNFESETPLHLSPFFGELSTLF